MVKLVKNNIRDILIWGYLTFFKIFFYIFSVLPLKNKTTFVISFGDNAIYIYEEMMKQKVKHDVVFLYKKSCKYNLQVYDSLTSIPFESFQLINEIKSIYHLATSKIIIVDNYFGFLSSIQLKKDVECIQVWHAAGAIKKFGLQDQSISKRTQKDINRFLNVYKQFNKIVVGSNFMGNIFIQAFNVTNDELMKTGVPRTDLFFNEKKMDLIKSKLISENPNLNNKKVILYAPTFRDDQLDHYELSLDLRLLYEKLGNEYVVLLRLHPAIKSRIIFEEEYPGFVYDYSSFIDINELFLITDILISDYSSVPFEFALLERPMLFYAYDLEEYQKSRGLWEDYQKMVPGPIARTSFDVVNIIENELFDKQQIKDFSLKWNEFSNGNASEKLVKYLHDKMEKHETYYLKG
ncbi:CDP-glycerol glycerophosphotransferase family protein [Heyndrickxia sporothermodurans]